MGNQLAAKERTDFKRSDKKSLRDSGEIPAVIYGNGQESKSIAINTGELLKTIKEVGRNGIISLELDGAKHNVMLSDFQKDPLKSHIYHADFLEVDLSNEIQAQVRVNLTGEAAGVKNGGVLQQSVHEVTVTARPNDIPESIDLDVSGLDFGDTVTFADLDVKDKLKIENEADEVIASVLAPRTEQETSEADETEESNANSDESAEA